jgi:hypothetical protein
MPRQSTSHTHIRLRSDDVQPSGTAWTLEMILDQAYSGAQDREGVCTVLFFCYRRLHNNLQACNRGTEEVHYLEYMLGQVLMLFDLHIGFGSTGAASQDGACWGVKHSLWHPVPGRLDLAASSRLLRCAGAVSAGTPTRLSECLTSRN